MIQHTVAVQGHPEKGHLLIEWFEKAGAKNFAHQSGTYPFFYFYINSQIGCEAKAPFYLTVLTFSEWESMIKEQEEPSKRNSLSETITTKEQGDKFMDDLRRLSEPTPKPVWDWIEIKEGCEMPVEAARILIKQDCDYYYIDRFKGKFSSEDTHYCYIQPPSTLNSSNQ